MRIVCTFGAHGGGRFWYNVSNVLFSDGDNMTIGMGGLALALLLVCIGTLAWRCCWDVERGIERIAAGLFGFALLAGVCIRLLHLPSRIFYKTTWGAIAGQPLIPGQASWDYGLWEVCPDGQMAALATILLIVALILGAILDCRRCYWLAGGVVVSGYLVNACLMLRLLAAY